MAELAAVALLGATIAASVGFGTRYINGQLRYENVRLSADAPIVRPLQPPIKETASQS